MRTYEGLFIFPPESGPDARKEELGALEELIKKYSGTIVDKNDWGKKPLGYLLKKHREGYFQLLHFKVPAENMNDFRKALELEERILKFMITVQNEKVAKKKSPKPAKAATRKPVQETAAT